MNIREKVLSAIDATAQNLYEREELSRLIWTTIGANLNFLMLGDPGTAKTMIAVNLTKTISGAKKFQYTLNSFTTVDEIFGHFDLIELKLHNKLKRNITNKLLDCHIAYLDEFFKSNSGTLNALLDVMNEKIHYDSNGKIELPLKFLISSSNELPGEEDGLSAVLDRFQVKYLVKAIQDHSTRIGAYLNSANELKTVEEVISLEEIDLFRAEVAKVKYTKEVAEMTETIYQDLLKENILVSDRTLFKSINLVKAVAFLRGGIETIPSDLFILKDVLWSQMSEIRTVKRIVYDRANPLYGKVEEVWDSIITTIEQKQKEISALATKDSAPVSFELVKKIKLAKTELKDLLKQIEALGANAGDTKQKIDYLTHQVDLLFGGDSEL